MSHHTITTSTIWKTLDNNNTHNKMYLQNVGSKVQELEKALYNNNTNTYAYVCLQNVGSKFQCLETPQTKKILDQLAAQGFSKGKSFYKVMMMFFY